jgi:hypothetical protein
LKIAHGYCDTARIGTLHVVIELTPPQSRSASMSVLAGAGVFLCREQFAAINPEVQYLLGLGTS